MRGFCISIVLGERHLRSLSSLSCFVSGEEFVRDHVGDADGGRETPRGFPYYHIHASIVPSRSPSPWCVRVCVWYEDDLCSSVWLLTDTEPQVNRTWRHQRTLKTQLIPVLFPIQPILSQRIPIYLPKQAWRLHLEVQQRCHHHDGAR